MVKIKENLDLGDVIDEEKYVTRHHKRKNWDMQRQRYLSRPKRSNAPKIDRQFKAAPVVNEEIISFKPYQVDRVENSGFSNSLIISAQKLK